MKQTHLVLGITLLASWVSSFKLPKPYMSCYMDNIITSTTTSTSRQLSNYTPPQQCKGIITVLHLKNPEQSNIMSEIKTFREVVDLEKYREIGVNLDKYREAIESSAIEKQPNELNIIIKVGEWSLSTVQKLASQFVIETTNNTRVSIPVAGALQKMKKDMKFLDEVASRTPQLSRLELSILIATVSLSALSPFILSMKIVEVLIPSLAALSASVGISAEYVGEWDVLVCIFMYLCMHAYFGTSVDILVYVCIKY